MKCSSPTSTIMDTSSSAMKAYYWFRHILVTQCYKYSLSATVDFQLFKPDGLFSFLACRLLYPYKFSGPMCVLIKKLECNLNIAVLLHVKNKELSFCLPSPSYFDQIITHFTISFPFRNTSINLKPRHLKRRTQ